MEAAIAKSEEEMEVDERLDLALSLVDALKDGQKDEVDSAISSLAHSYESSLFNEIGQITRHVHDALGFCSDDERISEIAQNEIPDARERLEYVIEKTESSANLTLDIAEEIHKDASTLSTDTAHIKSEWQRFTQREMKLEEFHVFSTELEQFFTRVENDTEKVRSSISDLIMAQDFQDLTGQIIKQVIVLVQEVESRLVGVIKRAGPEKSEAAPALKDIEAEGPQIKPEEKENVANDQEDVDALLSSFGF
ncbi:MAG: protein phosphatase [Gammaproteobacteria bacterium]|nr:protein phosphatase [Gammaproteobacteria bacterium]